MIERVSFLTSQLFKIILIGFLKEKVTNRSLQEQLKNEREKSERLEQQLEVSSRRRIEELLFDVWCLILQESESTATGGGGDMESRLSKVEERLKETEHERDGYKDVG